MKTEVPNQYRMREGVFFKSTDADGMKGTFGIPVDGVLLLVTCNISPGETDHIAVSNGINPVTEKQLDAVKRVFWDEDELEDLFEFGPQTTMNPNVKHVKKKKHDWKTKIY